MDFQNFCSSPCHSTALYIEAIFLKANGLHVCYTRIQEASHGEGDFQPLKDYH